MKNKDKKTNSKHKRYNMAPIRRLIYAHGQQQITFIKRRIQWKKFKFTQSNLSPLVYKFSKSLD